MSYSYPMVLIWNGLKSKIFTRESFFISPTCNDSLQVQLSGISG